MSPLATISISARDSFLATIARDARAHIEAERSFLPELTFRNNVLLAQGNHDRELILSGPAGTTKTVGLLTKVSREMRRHPRLRVLCIRLVRAALAESALASFEIDVVGESNPIVTNQQRQGRDVYRYPNGSIMVVGGLDQPKRWDGTFWDIIYVAQAEELSLSQWEMLTQRKARDGKYPHPQLIGDCNPDAPGHWIQTRSAEGKLTLLPTTHKDNPKYWDDAQQDWTRVGRDYVLGTLGDLTGIRRDRYLLGLWKSAEGAIIDNFDSAVHVIDRFDIPRHWRRFRAVDFGYKHPFVCQWWAVDPDGRMYMYREIYMTERLVEDHARDILKHSDGEKIETTVRDHDAEDAATLERRGIRTTPAQKEVNAGIQLMQSRFRVQPDGKPRIFFFRDARVEEDRRLVDTKRPTCTIEEIGGYVWNDKVRREEPVKINDDGMDTTRYAVVYVDGVSSQRRGIITRSRFDPYGRR